jgi:hypothetical protein
MSILDKGTETLEVWPPVEIVDEFGNATRRPGRPGVDTPELVENALVQPVTNDSDMSQGYFLLDVYRVIAREWPWPAKCIVRWDDRFWDVDKNPSRRRYTAATYHSTVIMSARNEEALRG